MATKFYRAYQTSDPNIPTHYTPNPNVRILLKGPFIMWADDNYMHFLKAPQSEYVCHSKGDQAEEELVAETQGFLRVWPVIFIGENFIGTPELIAAILPFEEMFFQKQSADRHMGAGLLGSKRFQDFSGQALRPRYNSVEKLLPLCDSIIWHPDLLEES